MTTTISNDHHHLTNPAVQRKAVLGIWIGKQERAVSTYHDAAFLDFGLERAHDLALTSLHPTSLGQAQYASRLGRTLLPSAHTADYRLWRLR